MKYIRIAMSVILVLVMGYLLTGQLVMPANTPKNGYICEELPGDNWYEVKADGTRTPFAVPGTTDSDITLETTLPEDMGKDCSALWFRGMDMEIYVGGELREFLKTEDYPLFGDRSAECYVMASVYPDDAGKTLKVHYEYNSGMVYEVYLGTRLGILAYLFKSYGAELFVGLLILMLALICYTAAVVYKYIHKQYLEMEHLALGALLGGIWVMSNSIFRQHYTSNLSIMSDTPFLMVMIMPLPFLIFINSMQKGRYSKALTIASVLETVNFIVCITLLVTGAVTLIQSFIASAVCAFVSIAVMFMTLILDLKHHLIGSYKYVAIGFAFLASAAVVQIAVYQFAHNGIFSGLFMAIGLFGFLIFSIIHTIKQLIGIRLEADEMAHISKAKDIFLANMSHEIRTPMNAIIGMDEMILREAKDKNVLRYAADIKSAGHVLLSIINDILDLSKIESGKMELIPVEYDFASVLNDIVNMTMNKSKDKGLKYDLGVEPDIPSVLRGDEIRIRQIILNLTNNAIKYTAEGRVSIHIGFDRGTNKLTVRVADTGMGIRPEDLGKLFSSFQRLDETKNRNIEGTGLGLNITKQLTEMMGGTIAVESEYGKGSVFTATIVQEVVDDTPIGNYTERLEKAQSEKAEFRPQLIAPEARVLIVDDNEMNLEVITALMKDTRMKITTAASGAECIDVLKDRAFDVIMLDQMMPGMSGTQTLAKIREQRLADDTPIIALTADAIVGARDQYIREGFSDYLSKPVMYSELEEVLLKFIDKRLLLTEEQLKEEAAAMEREKANKPIILVISDFPERLNSLKEMIGDRYKGVYVRDEKKARKYMEKYRVAYVIRDGESAT